MGLLDKHQKTNIRFKSEDFMFYEPTILQKDELKNMIKGTIKINKDLEISGDISLKEIRFVIKELTNIGNEIDELSDEEFKNKLNNGDRQVINLFREVENYINEVIEDIMYENEQYIQFINSFINIANTKADEGKIKDKVNRLLKQFDQMKLMMKNIKNGKMKMPF